MNGHIASVHEGKKYLNVTRVTKILLVNKARMDTLLQFMKEKKHLNVKFVIIAILKRVI